MISAKIYTRAFVLLFNFARRTKLIIPREQTKQPAGKLKALGISISMSGAVCFGYKVHSSS